jgi:uncharacterized protein (DUF2147 family)
MNDTKQAARLPVRTTAAAALAALALTVVAVAMDPSPAQAQATAGAPAAGLWKSIDDETKQPKALIRIVEQDGALVGRIERILTDKPDAVCDLCTDARKGQPVQGMVILQGMRRAGEEWTGGEILDPNNGKVYKARLRAVDGGAKLDVRGYIGIPALGRTQTWLREQ